MFRLNCYRIDVDTKVAGSENWHGHGDLAGGCWRTAVSKCDATSFIRNSDTKERRSGERKSDTALCLSACVSLSFGLIHTLILPLLFFKTILSFSFFSHTPMIFIDSPPPIFFFHWINKLNLGSIVSVEVIVVDQWAVTVVVISSSISTGRSRLLVVGRSNSRKQKALLLDWHLSDPPVPHVKAALINIWRNQMQLLRLLQTAA